MRRFVTSKAGNIILLLLVFSLVTVLIIKEDVSDQIRIIFRNDTLTVIDDRVEGSENKITIDIFIEDERVTSYTAITSPRKEQEIILAENISSNGENFRFKVHDISTHTRFSETILVFLICFILVLAEKKKK